MFCLTVSFPRRGGEVDAEVRRSVIGEMERGSPADNKRGGVRCPWVRVCVWLGSGCCGTLRNGCVRKLWGSGGGDKKGARSCRLLG